MSNPLAKRFALYIALAIAAFAIFETYIAIHASRAVDERLRDMMEQRQPLDIVLMLGFKPQPIHLRLFQQYGAVAGVDGEMVTLLRVPAGRIGDLARYYWIKSISPKEQLDG